MQSDAPVQISTAPGSASSTVPRAAGSVRTVPVAAVITTFNGRSRGFLEKAMQSVLNQTVAPEEFVIIDDGSKDDTAEWVRTHYPQVRIVTKPNGGPASARNRGAQETKSPYLCYLDDDDMWLPHKLESQFRIMSQPAAPDLLFSSATIINERDEPTGAWLPADVFYGWPDVLLQNPIISPCCAMIRREAFVEAGGFNEAVDHKFVEDYELWIKIARRHRLESRPEPLTLYRKHSSQNSKNYAGILGKVLPIVRSYAAKEPGLDPRKVAAYHIYGGFLFALGHMGREVAFDLIRTNPNDRWFPVLLLFRAIGAGLNPFRSVQRKWRRFEARRILGRHRKAVAA